MKVTSRIQLSDSTMTAVETVRRIDRIMVMERGRVAASGKH
jgi:hypothetical protein